MSQIEFDQASRIDRTARMKILLDARFVNQHNTVEIQQRSTGSQSWSSYVFVLLP
jgi:hypothetical protein